MPIYRYQCTECGAREEHLQKFSDPPVEVCQACGGALSKSLTAAAFHLKGGGWYKDLYASAKPGASSTESAGKSDGGAADSSSGKSSDSKSSSSSSAASSSSSSGSSSASAPSAA